VFLVCYCSYSTGLAAIYLGYVSAVFVSATLYFSNIFSLHFVKKAIHHVEFMFRITVVDQNVRFAILNFCKTAVF
jgi:hypothetical protein